MKIFSVYILANQRNGTLYIGVTSNLCQRVYQHRQKEVKGFASKYNITKLVYHEETVDNYSALTREKKLKKWNRAWKIRLIEENNPRWADLFDSLCGGVGSGFPPARE